VIAPLRASTPHGSCESAMNEATSGLTSAAFVVQQPAEVDVNEIVIRPAAQV
jgi:NADP-dependent 3-hydroxy acid dehydrogenase YdfG